MRILTVFWLFIAVMACRVEAAEPVLPADCIFHASFDASADADLAKGDGKIRTAESLKREHVKSGLQTDAVRWTKTGGKTGGALQFLRKTDELVFFTGGKNVPYRDNQFQGTVSLWMKLSPKEDLPKGYVDPLQITDKKWNDSSFFVDFDQAESRDFRLGVFSDFAVWNPKNRKFDDIPVKERPMVVVKDPPFSRDRWTHVAFTWNDFNQYRKVDSTSAAKLYLNGELQGTIDGRQRFTWTPEKAVIMLGINYVGWMDEVSIYGRALSAKEVQRLAKVGESATTK